MPVTPERAAFVARDYRSVTLENAAIAARWGATARQTRDEFLRHAGGCVGRGIGAATPIDFVAVLGMTAGPTAQMEVQLNDASPSAPPVLNKVFNIRSPNPVGSPAAFHAHCDLEAVRTHRHYRVHINKPRSAIRCTGAGYGAEDHIRALCGA